MLSDSGDFVDGANVGSQRGGSPRKITLVSSSNGPRKIILDDSASSRDVPSRPTSSSPRAGTATNAHARLVPNHSVPNAVPPQSAGFDSVVGTSRASGGSFAHPASVFPGQDPDSVPAAEPRLLMRRASSSTMSNNNEVDRLEPPALAPIDALQPHVEARALFRIGGVRLTVDEAALVKKLVREADPAWIPCDLVSGGKAVAVGLLRVRGKVLEVRDVSTPLSTVSEVRAATRTFVLEAGTKTGAAPDNASVVEVSTPDMKGMGIDKLQLSCRRPHVVRSWINAAAESV